LLPCSAKFHQTSCCVFVHNRDVSSEAAARLARIERYLMHHKACIVVDPFDSVAQVINRSVKHYCIISLGYI
jgi:hypothetical protein